MTSLNVKVQRGADFNFNHYLSRIKIKLIPSNTRKKIISKYRIKELKINQKIIDEYQKELDTLGFFEWDKMAARIQAVTKQKNF